MSKAENMPFTLITVDPARRELRFGDEGGLETFPPVQAEKANLDKFGTILAGIAIKGPGAYVAAKLSAEIAKNMGEARPIGASFQHIRKLIPPEVVNFDCIGSGKGSIEAGNFAIAFALPTPEDEQTKREALRTIRQQKEDFKLEQEAAMHQKQKQRQEELEAKYRTEDDKKFDLSLYNHLELQINDKPYILNLDSPEAVAAVRLLSAIKECAKEKADYTRHDIFNRAWKAMKLTERSSFGYPFNLYGYLREGDDNTPSNTNEASMRLRLRIDEPSETSPYNKLDIKALIDDLPENSFEALLGKKKEDESCPVPETHTPVLRKIVADELAPLSQEEAVKLLETVMDSRYDLDLAKAFGLDKVDIKKKLVLLKERLHRQVESTLGNVAYGIAYRDRVIGMHSTSKRNPANVARLSGGKVQGGTTLNQTF